MPSPRMIARRRIVALVLLFVVLNGLATPLVLCVLFLAGLLEWAWPFTVDVVASSLLGVVSLGLFVALAKWTRFFNGLNPAELAVLLRWLVTRGDLLGHTGKNHCHRCDYDRGPARTCTECGAERIDPLPESTEP